MIPIPLKTQTEMRIGILSFEQSDYDTPTRFVPEKEVRTYFASGFRWVSKKVIKENFPKSLPSSSPSRHYSRRMQVVKLNNKSLPQLRPPQPPMTLNLFYPVKDQSSFAERNMTEIWGNQINIPSIERLREVYGETF